MSVNLLDVTAGMVKVVAESDGVCIRPQLRRVSDQLTGETVTVALPCGSTRETRCPPCAGKAQRLRMQQCQEGWHLVHDPEPDHGDGQDRGDDPLAGGVGGRDGEGSGRRARSTRRIEGFPDLPEVPMAEQTTGRGFTDPVTGRVFRPSMFLTLTLPSYGRVLPGTGIPVRPREYDYRGAALDALLFPRLLDRFWQNLRRCAGYKVQYFSAIEAQRRLSPHLHAALRGAIPRATLKAVVRATYFAAWWPAIDQVVYDGDRLPVWDPTTGRYVDPDTGAVLPTWDEAVDTVDEPMHVVAFGSQVDIKGILGGTQDSARAVRYLCKYLTKSITGTYADDGVDDRDADAPVHSQALAYDGHIDRLHEEVRWLPCSPACANWLRYGVEPDQPGPGLVPGHCAAPAHERENLGLGGRRVLASRAWTGKTLAEHRADRRAVVAEVLAAAGYTPDEADRLAASHSLPDGRPRFVWHAVPAVERDYVSVMVTSIRESRRWREVYQQAKALAAERQRSPGVPVDNRSATGPAA